MDGILICVFFFPCKSIKIRRFRLLTNVWLFCDDYFTYQKVHPRFQAENMDKNKNIYERIESLAKMHRITPAQLALAWLLQQGEDVVPIPGEWKNI